MKELHYYFLLAFRKLYCLKAFKFESYNFFKPLPFNFIDNGGENLLAFGVTWLTSFQGLCIEVEKVEVVCANVDKKMSSFFHQVSNMFSLSLNICFRVGFKRD